MKYVSQLLGLIILASILGCGDLSSKDKQELRRLRASGFIPQGATQVVVRDNHGGWHGDGCSFVTFRSSETDPAWGMPLSMWKMMPLEPRAQKTLDIIIRDFSIPVDQLPDRSSSSVSYFIDDNSGRHDAYTGHLYIRDEENMQFWYFNITT